jgi:hypothetical protein
MSSDTPRARRPKAAQPLGDRGLDLIGAAHDADGFLASFGIERVNDTSPQTTDLQPYPYDHDAGALG